MHLELQRDDERFRLGAERDGDGWVVARDGEPLATRVISAADGVVELQVDGERRRAWVARRGPERLVFLDGRVFTLRLADDDVDDALDAPGARGPHLTAEMPGTVVKVLVAEGDRVDVGDPLLILEAMKMETEIAAPLAGRVARIHAEAGRTLMMGEPLLDIEPEPEDGEG